LNTNIKFLKAKNIVDFVWSSEETPTTKEDGNTLPTHPYFGRLKKGSKEKSAKTRHIPTLRRSGK
jgi:hypothetical protein